MPDGTPLTGGQDEETEWFVVDEDRAAVVDGPYSDKDEALGEAGDREPGHILMTGSALEMMALTSTATIRWETDDDGPDIVTDGMGPVGPSGGAANPTPDAGVGLGDDTDTTVGKSHHCDICDTAFEEVEALFDHVCAEHEDGGDYG